MSTRLLTVILLVLALLLAASCSRAAPLRPVGEDEEIRIKAELKDRSFRQFVPSRDASPRKGVMLEFSGRVSIWAQYAEGNQAVNEWEIVSGDYRIESRGDRDEDTSEITVQFDQPKSTRGLPSRCEDCILTSGVSISIRNVFDPGRISFRINDPNGVLPSPFPVFESWTRFSEDEYME